MNNNDSKAKLLAETVAMLRAVLISSPLGVKFDKLYRDYKQLTGKTIPYQELGYPRLEFFIQNIPHVARAEKGADNEWILKGVASDADKHVAKMISKQKKPKVRSRKSAQFIASGKPGMSYSQQPRFNSPVKQTRKPPTQQRTTVLAPRFQRRQSEQNENLPPTDLRHRITGVLGTFLSAAAPKRKVYISGKQSDGNYGGSIFQKATENVNASRLGKSNRTVTQNSQEKGFLQDRNISMSVSVNEKTGRNVRTVTAIPPDHDTSILQNPSVVQWIKEVVAKSPNGLWATRLAVLFHEEFKKDLTDEAIMALASRQDIVRTDEPIEGRFLLYAPIVQQQNAPVKQEQKHSASVQPQHVQPKKNKTALITKVEPPCQTENLDVVLTDNIPDVGSICMVFITHVENVGCFYVSKSDCISSTLSTDMLKQYESTKYNADSIPSVTPGQIFCAQYTGDGSFYRACVLEVVDSKHVLVLYVDFGNQEVISVNRLRILKKTFQSQPVQSFKCCLDGIQPANEDQDWSEAAKKKFSDLVLDKDLKITVKDIEGKILSINLYDESSKTDIGDELLKAAMASPIKNLTSTPSSSSSSLSSSSGQATMLAAPLEKVTLPKKDGVTQDGIKQNALSKDGMKKEGISRDRSGSKKKAKLPVVVEIPKDPFIDVLVCNITGTHNVYLRLVGDEYSNKFEAIQESMTCYYSDSKDEVITEILPGDLYALFSDDVWCRVKVQSVNEASIKVFFVDHGDIVETNKSELRVLAPQFKRLPLQVFQCALNGLPKTRNLDVVDKLQKLTMHGEVCVAEVIKRTSDLVFVELIDTRSDANLVVNDVVRKLVIPDEELKPVLPKVGESVEVYVPYISPAGRVFLHLPGAGIKRLEELNNDLTENYLATKKKASEFVSNPPVDKVYCVMCDNNWYRVKIISPSGKNAVEVLYVDYGNSETVVNHRLRELPQAIEHVLSLPFQVLECQLYDIPKDDWNEDFAKEVMDILSSGVVTAEVLCEGDIPSVSLVVTVSEKDDEQGLTERLTRFLGRNYDEDDIREAIESAQYDGAEGPLVNGDKNDDNDKNDIGENNHISAANENERISGAKEDSVEKDETNVAQNDETIVDEKNIHDFGETNVAEKEEAFVDEKNIHVGEKNVAKKETIVDEKNIHDFGEQNVAEKEEAFVDEKNIHDVGEKNVAKKETIVDEKNIHDFGEKNVAEKEEAFVDEKNIHDVGEKNVAKKETIVDEKNIHDFGEQNVAEKEEAIVDEKNIHDVDEKNVAKRETIVDEKNIYNFGEENFAEKDIDVVENVDVVVETNVGNEGRTVVDDENKQMVPCDVANEERVAIDREESRVNSAPNVGNDGAAVEGAVANEIVNKPFPGKELPLDSGWMDILVTDVKDPGDFTFQLLTNIENLYELTDKMNEYYQNNSPIEETPVEGDLYAAFQNEDDCWYRAIAEAVSKEKVFVRFVDYGDRTVIEKGEDIQPLHEDFLQLPLQGIRACLAGIKYPKKKWASECKRSFKYQTSECQLVAKVTSSHASYDAKQKGPVSVELYDTSDPKNDVSIAAKLIELKYAESEPIG